MLSRDLKDNETVTVNVYAPSLSAEDIQRGNRGFAFIDGTEEKKTLSVTFTKDDCDAKAVTIKAIGDNLVEGNDYFALLHKVVSSTTSCKPCRNAVLFFKDTSERTQEYIISDDGRVAEAYGALEKKLAKYPSKHRDAINEYIRESLEKFLNTI